MFFTPARRRDAHELAGRLRWLDALTLVAVGLVVLLVSLPRLREFALAENESDARSLVAHLGELLAKPVHASESAPSVESLVHESSELARQLDDAEFLEQGRLLRRHGYLFELARAGGDSPACVRAWPWHYKQTGVAAYAWTASIGLQGHANDGGQWSGPAQPPPSSLDVESGWKPIHAR
jgi:hypothetical protein